MTNEFGTVLLCTGAVAVNFVYNIRHDKDIFVPLLAGGLFTTACVFIGELEPAIGTALAGVFFLSVFLTRGTEIINFTSTLVKETG